MRIGKGAALVLAALTLVPAAPVAAQIAMGATQPAIPKLKPGQFRWLEEPQLVKASTGAGDVLRIFVAIQQQQALVYRGERLVAVTTVSTGAPGYDTPLGEFTILEKKIFHRSNLYDDAPMPYMQRLTWDGIALHAGAIPGRPASHGCIRLPRTFAKQLYDLTEKGGTVVIVDDVADAPLYLPMAPTLIADTSGLAAQGAGMADPEPVLTADTAALAGKSEALAKRSPALAAETRNLGGGAFDVLTMGGEAPGSSSWVKGPARSPRGSR